MILMEGREREKECVCVCDCVLYIGIRDTQLSVPTLQRCVDMKKESKRGFVNLHITIFNLKQQMLENRDKIFNFSRKFGCFVYLQQNTYRENGRGRKRYVFIDTRGRDRERERETSQVKIHIFDKDASMAPIFQYNISFIYFFKIEMS